MDLPVQSTAASRVDYAYDNYGTVGERQQD
jgi:hypothetical protein